MLKEILGLVVFGAIATIGAIIAFNIKGAADAFMARVTAYWGPQSRVGRWIVRAVGAVFLIVGLYIITANLYEFATGT